jgi:ferredoxin
MQIDERKCVGCGNCVPVYTMGVISVVNEKEKRYQTPFRSEVLESVEGRFQFLTMGGSGGDTVKPYPGVEDLVGPAVRVRMPRAANPVPRRPSFGRRAVHA